MAEDLVNGERMIKDFPATREERLKEVRTLARRLSDILDPAEPLTADLSDELDLLATGEDDEYTDEKLLATFH